MTNETRLHPPVAYGRHAPRALLSRPKVSVVIPLYNYGHLLPACVASVVDQPDVDLEVIVVDDRSTDDSVAVAHSLAATYPFIRVLQNATNQGHVVTTNRGVSEATGEFVVKLDADDMLTPGSLARSAALLQAWPSVGFVYGFPLFFRDPQPPRARLTPRSWTIWPGARWLERVCRLGQNVIAQPEVMVRRSAFDAIGLYREDMPRTPDFELWLRLATRFDVGRINGADQGFYRLHDKSMSHTVHRSVTYDMEQRLRVFEALIEDRPERQEWLDAARLAIARQAVDFAFAAFEDPAKDPAHVDELLAVAFATYPAARDWRSVRVLTTLRPQGPNRAKRSVTLAALRVRRDLRGRLAWRRWRATGL